MSRDKCPAKLEISAQIYYNCFMENVTLNLLVTQTLSDEQVNLLKSVAKTVQVDYFPAKNWDAVPEENWKNANVLLTHRTVPPVEKAPNLRWIHTTLSGVDHLADSGWLERDNVEITTSSGVSSLAVAEHVLAMFLALDHRLSELHDFQLKSEWWKQRLEKFRPSELRGSTVGIIGYGSIGREVARLLQPFNVRVLAAKRDAMNPLDTGFAAAGTGDPNGDLFTRLYPMQAVATMVKDCDFVVVSVPLTAETRGMINAEVFNAMRPNAYLVDVSRGGVVDHAALVTAVKDKKLAGAALDVFPEEPLPPESPLWTTPNITITPHLAGISRENPARALNLFLENLKSYLDDDTLLNRYDRKLGY